MVGLNFEPRKSVSTAHVLNRVLIVTFLPTGQMRHVLGGGNTTSLTLAPALPLIR